MICHHEAVHSWRDGRDAHKDSLCLDPFALIMNLSSPSMLYHKNWGMEVMTLVVMFNDVFKA